MVGPVPIGRVLLRENVIEVKIIMSETKEHLRLPEAGRDEEGKGRVLP